MDMTIAELIHGGHCIGACLAGVTDHQNCGCTRCHGRLHGVVADIRVPGTEGMRQPLPPPQPGPHLFDELEEIELEGVSA